MFLGDWLGRRARLSPDKVALIDATRDGRAITFEDWNRTANRTAHFLRALGVGRGDRVAVLAHNAVETLDVWFACGKLGAVFQPLNWRLKPPELGGLLADTTPRVLLYGPEFLETARSLRAGDRELIAMDPADRADRSLDERDGFNDADPPGVELGWDDPWVFCSTGGTTGLPKAAVLTHGNIAWNAINTVMSWGLRPDDVTILNAPLFHTGGLNVFTAPLVHIGGTSIVCRGFDPGQVLRLIREHPVTIYFGVPTMLLALQNHPAWEASDWSRLRLIFSGGAPCPAPIVERFRAKGRDLRIGYGLTEAGPNTFWMPERDLGTKPGSVGVPLFHIDVKIVDHEGDPCGPDQVGELLIRGPHVCSGYWNRPDETARTFRDGWLHTGDLARRDADGHYFLVGRLKDVIISGGENIYPGEVEAVLAGHPAVAEAAVIGVPDPAWGEVPWALVVPAPGCRLDPEEIRTYAADRLARYKLPKRVIVATALPRTAAGKIDKEELKKAHGS